MTRSTAIGIFLLCWLLAFGASANSQPLQPTEAEVKAAFVFNFLKFVEWSDDTLDSAAAPPSDRPDTLAGGDSVLTVMVAGDVSDVLLIHRIVLDKRVHGRRVVVTRYERTSDTAIAHALYITAGHEEEFLEILGNVADKPVLTIGDCRKFAESGGMIEFYTQDARVRFRVNPEAVERAGLRLSSKLLKLADLVAAK